jgi:hypothetical protein
MFDSLADRIREDEQETATQKYMKYLAVAVISIVLFGGLYAVVHFLEK